MSTVLIVLSVLNFALSGRFKNLNRENDMNCIKVDVLRVGSKITQVFPH